MADDLVLLAEEHRASLPPGFDAVAQELAVLLETGKPIDVSDRGGSLNLRIRQAVVRELQDFLAAPITRSIGSAGPRQSDYSNVYY